jgi:large subunit ribosomal protein L21
MFAIVEISGEQFKIDGTTKTLRVPYMVDAEAGQQVNIDKVLLSQDDNGNVKLGSGASLKASVVGHTRGEKVIVFHKKRRKGYRKTNGHTPKFTELSIEKFSV